jgi:very-short-patch-repair endonuclease
MTESHILASDNANPGVHALKNFLSFAQTGRLSQLKHTNKEPDSDFEISVINALKLEGFSCVPQVGVAGYFIDIAVQDPGQPGRYMMGIECDGATYHSAKSARDRDRLRQSVLENLGWEIKRIWSTDWFKNPQAQLKPIIERLNQLKTEVKEQPQKETEMEQIQADIEEESQRLQQTDSISHSEDTLESKLQKFAKQVIANAVVDVPKNNSLLRAAMIDALCEFKPISKSEFLEKIPAYLRNNVSPKHGEFLEQVLNIIAEDEEENII